MKMVLSRALSFFVANMKLFPPQASGQAGA